MTYNVFGGTLTLLNSTLGPLFCNVYKNLSKLVDKCRRYSKLKHHCFQDTVYSTTEKTISGVYVSPGSAETLVRISGIAINVR